MTWLPAPGASEETIWALIALDHVSKVYPKGTRPALDDVNLDIERGDFVFLVGASGSGKTTLLSLLLREEEATDGEIRVAGNDLRRLTNRQVPQYRRSIGFVFQDYKLLANKTVWQNVAFALEVIGTRRSAIKSLVPQVLQTVGLTGKENNYPHELVRPVSSSVWPRPRVCEPSADPAGR